MTDNTPFVGSVPPHLFLDRFLQTEAHIPPAPQVDFSELSGGPKMKNFCELFVSSFPNPLAMIISFLM